MGTAANKSTPTSEGINGDQHGSDVSVYVAIGPAFLEVLVNALVTNRGQQGHIRHPYLGFLKALLPVRLRASHSRRMIVCLTIPRTLATLAGPALAGVAPFLAAFLEIACAKMIRKLVDTTGCTRHRRSSESNPSG